MKLCSLFLCIRFHVCAPGSHCFAIEKLNRSAICTVHFRSILSMFNPQKLGRQQSNCSKTGPKKIKPEEKNQRSIFPTGFQMSFFPIFPQFFTFFPSAFSKRIFHIFSKCIFKTHLFRTFSQFFEKSEKCVSKMRLKKLKTVFLKCEKM